MNEIGKKKKKRLYALFNRETEAISFYTTMKGLYYACIPHFPDKVPTYFYFRAKITEVPKQDVGNCIVYHIVEVYDTYNEGKPSKNFGKHKQGLNHTENGENSTIK